MPKTWTTVSEASEQHGIPRRTLIHAIQTGQLEAEKPAARTAAYVIERADLDTYLAARAATTDDPAAQGAGDADRPAPVDDNTPPTVVPASATQPA